MNFNLSVPFHQQALTAPECLALSLDKNEFTYGQLATLAARIARWLRDEPGGKPSFVAILASRSLTTYAGILGSLWAGAAYVPLNPKAPDARLSTILQMITPAALIVDPAHEKRLNAVLLECPACRVLAPETEIPEVPRSLEGRVAGSRHLPPADASDSPESIGSSDLAYVMFTSGTTGVPKGVMVTAGNAAQFLAAVRERYPFGPHDRVSQWYETTFDPSVFDMFVTWGVGASLHVVPATQIIGPRKFILDKQLTVWSTVPSTISFMRQMKMLRPGSFPALRYSMFCGEPLPVDSAQSWQQAAPQSIVDNLYGPTEATVVCTGERLSEPPNITPNRGVLAIGRPFTGVELAILDENRRSLPDGHEGELAIGGGQVARGYFKNADQTAKHFVSMNGQQWYLTGDLAVRDRSGAYHHLGRIDNQIKVLGRRVELEEVEAHLRAVCGSDSVAAVAWPVEHGSATGIVAFVCGAAVSPNEIRAAMRQRVPAYMVPSSIIEKDALPLGVSGKTDRRALVAWLAQHATA